MKSFFGLSASVIAVYNVAFFYHEKTGNENKSETCIKTIPSSKKHNVSIQQYSEFLVTNNNNRTNGVPLMLFLSIYII